MGEWVRMAMATASEVRESMRYSLPFCSISSSEKKALLELVNYHFLKLDAHLLPDGADQIMRERSERSDPPSRGLSIVLLEYRSLWKPSYSLLLRENQCVGACLNLTERDPQYGKFNFCDTTVCNYLNQLQIYEIIGRDGSQSHFLIFLQF